MYELIQAGERTWYINCPAKMGIYQMNEGDVCLIDSGNDKDAAKKVLKILDANAWTLKMVINTHSHADHIGGNRLLQERTGCKIYAAGTDRVFISHPVLEPSLLYGGYPCKELRNKFLMAQESVAEELTEAVLPEGMEMLRLDGHSLSMTALKTADGVWFLADSLAGDMGIEKYHVSFLYDVKGYLESLEKIKHLTGTLFVPAHAEATEDIVPLVQRNIDKVVEITGVLKKICEEPKRFEDILKLIFDHYGLTMDFNQYVLVGSTIRSYLSYLHDDGDVAVVFADNQLYYKTA